MVGKRFSGTALHFTTCNSLQHRVSIVNNRPYTFCLNIIPQTATTIWLYIVASLALSVKMMSETTGFWYF